jgi:hypothetical protein
MVSKELVDRLLRESSLDEETCEYVSALILDGEEPIDELTETLASFLCDEEVILAQLVKAMSTDESPKQEDERLATTELRRLDQAVIMTALPPPPAAVVMTEPSPTAAVTEIKPQKCAPTAAPVPASAQLFGSDDYGSAQHAALDELDDLE